MKAHNARNARIFNMFSLISVGERSGTGLCDVFNTWKAKHLAEPRVIEAVNPDRTTLVLEGDFLSQNQSGDSGEPVEGKILEMLAASPDMTQKEISSKLSLSLSSVKYYMGKFQDDGSIVRVGNNRDGYWQVKGAKKSKKS